MVRPELEYQKLVSEVRMAMGTLRALIDQAKEALVFVQDLKSFIETAEETYWNLEEVMRPWSDAPAKHNRRPRRLHRKKKQ